MSKIKWYDYVAAVLIADIIQVNLFALLASTSPWASIIFGLSIYSLFLLWDDFYCRFRAGGFS